MQISIFKIMLDLHVNLNKSVIGLVLLFLSSLNGSSLSTGNLDSNSDSSDSSQCTSIYRRMTSERFAHDKVINTVLNINDSNAAEVFNNFNVSRDDVLRRIENFGQSQPNNLNSRPTNSEHEANWNHQNDSNKLPTDSEKEMFIRTFKKTIESAVDRNSSRHMPDWGTAAIHDMAFYPLCSKINQTSWMEENTAKLYFSSEIFNKLVPNTYLHRAILRLRQKIPDNLAITDASVINEPDLQNGCSEVDDIIHVKISIFVKRSIRGETRPVVRKLVCQSLTLNRLNNDWVEIDVRRVVKNWEKMYRASLVHNKGGNEADPMVAIDIEDEYQQPLKAGLFFEPTDCQASPAIPWNLCGDLLGTEILPNNPRLDIKWSRHRQHRHRSHHLRNMNHLENLRLLNDFPLLPADYQYQALTDQSDVNLESTSRNYSNLRKRHAQQRNRGTGDGNYFNDRHRAKRSIGENKHSAKRKFSKRV